MSEFESDYYPREAIVEQASEIQRVDSTEPESAEILHSNEATETTSAITNALNELNSRQEEFMSRIEAAYKERARKILDEDAPDALLNALEEISLATAHSQDLARVPEILSAWESTHAAYESGQMDQLEPSQLAAFQAEMLTYIEGLRKRQDVIERYVQLQEEGADYIQAMRVFADDLLRRMRQR